MNINRIFTLGDGQWSVDKLRWGSFIQDSNNVVTNTTH